jgi:hypothetical protein
VPDESGNYKIWRTSFFALLGTGSAIPKLNPEENQRSNIKTQNDKL